MGLLPMLKTCYCSRCLDKIFNHGEIALNTFLEISLHYYFEKKPFEFSTNIHASQIGIQSIVHFLESKGYVTTTESSEEKIRVKPKGFSKYFDFDEDVHFFCLCRGNDFDE
jgi:hypothetical protein